MKSTVVWVRRPLVRFTNLLAHTVLTVFNTEGFIGLPDSSSAHKADKSNCGCQGNAVHYRLNMRLHDQSANACSAPTGLFGLFASVLDIDRTETFNDADGPRGIRFGCRA
jgi:hypothetical protein